MHGVIVDVIQKVHEHVAVRAVVATDLRKLGLAEIWALLNWRVRNEVPIATLASFPQLSEIQILCDCRRRGSTFVEGRLCRTRCAEREVVDYDAVRGFGATGKLCI